MTTVFARLATRLASIRHATPAPIQRPPTAALTLAAALLLTLLAPAASAMMHPQMGRFLQRDPVGTSLQPLASKIYSGESLNQRTQKTLSQNPLETFGDLQSQRPSSRVAVGPSSQYRDGTNLYSYVRNQPTRYTDADGLQAQPPITLPLRPGQIVFQSGMTIANAKAVCDACAVAQPIDCNCPDTWSANHSYTIGRALIKVGRYFGARPAYPTHTWTPRCHCDERGDLYAELWTYNTGNVNISGPFWYYPYGNPFTSGWRKCT